MRIIDFWAVQDVRDGRAAGAAGGDRARPPRGGEYFGPRRPGLRRRFLTGYPAVVESSAGPATRPTRPGSGGSQELTGVELPPA